MTPYRNLLCSVLDTGELVPTRAKVGGEYVDAYSVFGESLRVDLFDQDAEALFSIFGYIRFRRDATEIAPIDGVLLAIFAPPCGIACVICILPQFFKRL
jgi:hypothetical protein